jgi:dipeptidyl aminopeptidase/acylaminoacyl peptidase
VQPHWPSWSPDGTQLVFANYDLLAVPASAQNLYVVDEDGSDLHQITGFSQIEGFRYGARWSPEGDALVGAATVLGVNGLWVVPLTADRHACGAPPVRLPTTPGDPIDFVGSVFVPPRPPDLTIRRELDDVIVSWRRTAWPYVLQTAIEPTPSAAWLSIPPPYPVMGADFEYRVPGVFLQPNSFFRLRLP